MTKRKVDMVVISDVHLGTYGCHANELLQYLNSIEPGIVILNGDIVDIWQFRKRYWPNSHMQVVKKIFSFLSAGVPVYYLTGNHDEMLRRFSGLQLGNFYLKDKLVIELDGQKAWFFHGDVFDVTMRYAKWLAKLGAVGYDTLILINRSVNWLLEKLGRPKISLSKRIKDSVKSAVKYINDFEQVAAELAIDNGYKFVICGHIHQPAIRDYKTDQGMTTYLNSGDWIENLTSLEYNAGKWSMYQHDSSQIEKETPLKAESTVDFLKVFENSEVEETVLFSQLIKLANAS